MPYKSIKDRFGISIRKMERLYKERGWKVDRKTKLISSDFIVKTIRANSLLCIRYDDKLVDFYRERENNKSSALYKELDDFDGEYYDPAGLEEEIINTL